MSQKLWKRSLVIVLALTLIPTMLASAGSYRSPVRDTSCYFETGQCYNDYFVTAASQAPIGGGACQPSAVGYIAWDLSAETRTWASATLKLTAHVVNGGTDPRLFTFAVYPANNDTWLEDGPMPGYSTATTLATASDSLADGIVEFRDDASNALGSYFLSKKGGPASVAIVMTDGCGNINGEVAFVDREGTGTSEPVNEPDLIFYTGDATTAVALSGFAAEKSAPTWPLYAGLGAVALVVIAGLAVSRRRTA